MRCWRVCGAYSLRITKRHSTLMLIISFIMSMTIILPFYARRRHQDRFSPHSIGDFEYRPGAFLDGQQPNETINYCQFNYGLPETLKWGTFSVLPSPEAGLHGNYRVIYNAIKGTAYENASKFDTVTYATQATPEFLYHIVEIARYWDGPISLSVFVPDYDLDITMQIMNQLCHCYSGMSKVSLHLFYTKRFPPKMIRDPVTTTVAPVVFNETQEEILRRKIEGFRNLTRENRAEYIQNSIKNKIKKMMASPLPKRSRAPRLYFDDCTGLDFYDLPTFRRENNIVYPINVGRNSARNASRTNYFIVSDIELVPSDGLAPKFINMLRKLIGNKKRYSGIVIPKTVFVVPIFEVEQGEQIPRSKETLVNLVAENRAMYFHQKVCSHCQRFPGLQTWLQRPAIDEVEPMLSAERVYPYHRWEPLYFGTNREPWYSEVLSWEGLQDKMTQMLELCLEGYRMVILDGGFLCHAAKPHDAKASKNRYSVAKRVNAKHYERIINSFKLIYPDRSPCKINHRVAHKS